MSVVHRIVVGLGVLIAAFEGGATLAFAAEVPPIAVLGENGFIAGELIYPLDQRSTPSCHASTIVETADGLVAAWFGGTAEGKDDVGIWVARQLQGKWSAPVEVATGKENSERDYPCWNPVLFQPDQGPLLLFYKVGPSPRAWWGVLRTSDDGGQTWSDPRTLGEDKNIGHLLGPVKNKPVQLADGSILCPSSSEHDGWRVHFEVTRDLGKTWEVFGPINDGKEFGAIQPSILKHAENKLQILCRSRQKVITQSWSHNGGKTWEPMTATSLPNPNSGTDAVTLQDGRQVLVYNHTASGRGMLNVAISKDGIEWMPIFTLENSKGEFSYPAVIQAKDGKVHVTYTYQRQSIKHVVLDMK